MTHRAQVSPSNRLEAFSDAVFAIILTIMVLNFRVPTGHHFSDLVELRPVFLSYLLSFIYLIIYWNNHHHLLRTVEFPNGWTMWANAHLLFWLSLVPFTTAWLGTSNGEKAPAALYGFSLLFSAIAYTLLQISIIRSHGTESPLGKALGRDVKGKISMALYIVGIIAAFLLPLVSYIFYVVVAILWVIPDRRIAAELNADHVD